MKSFKEYYLEALKISSKPLAQKTEHVGFSGKVFVYYNINLSNKLKSPYFSIKDIKTGKVIGHDTKIMLKDAMFKVLQSGRQRVINTGRKNVHAGAVGFLTHETPVELPISITYNPYKYNSFVVKNTEEPIHKAKLVSFIDRKVTAEV
jgi:hypothetical protein